MSEQKQVSLTKTNLLDMMDTEERVLTIAFEVRDDLILFCQKQENMLKEFRSKNVKILAGNELLDQE